MTRGFARPTRVDVAARRVSVEAAPPGEFTYSIVEADLRPPGGDRRREGRMRTRLREALVAERRGRTLVDCRIRDLTRGGARLQLGEERRLPHAFLLTDASAGRAYRATLVWQKGREAGVRLVPVE